MTFNVLLQIFNEMLCIVIDMGMETRPLGCTSMRRGPSLIAGTFVCNNGWPTQRDPFSDPKGGDISN